MEKKTYGRILVGVADRVMKTSVNQACVFFTYQPKLPKGVEKFKVSR